MTATTNESHKLTCSDDDDSQQASLEEVKELKISLKNESKFKNIKNVRSLAMDIGGSLVKLAFLSSYEKRSESFSEVI